MHDDIKEILVSGNSLIITFKNDSNSQFLECNEIDAFLHQFQIHCPSLEIKTIDKD